MQLSEEVREEIRMADIIFLQDKEDENNREIIYGRAMLQRSVAEGRTMKAKVCVIPIDFSTNELEFVLAAVVVLKGRHEYKDRTVLN